MRKIIIRRFKMAFYVLKGHSVIFRVKITEDGIAPIKIQGKGIYAESIIDTNLFARKKTIQTGKANIQVKVPARQENKAVVA